VFKIKDILEITKGKLICGELERKVNGISIDSRTIKRDELFIAIKGEKYDGHDFIFEAIRKGAVCIIKETRPPFGGCPEKPVTKKIAFIEVKDTIRALGDLARFHRKRFDIPVIAITGSNGKTTTKEMLADCLKEEFSVLKNEGTKNNFIGVPLTLLKLNSKHDLAVIELGTNHFGEIEYLARITQPNIGLITNIGPSHLENLLDLEGVFSEKRCLIEGLNSKGYGIINGDDPFLRRLIKDKHIFTYGVKRSCDLIAKKINCNGEVLSFNVYDQNFSLNTTGVFNVYNAMATISISLLFGLSLKSMASTLKRFEFPEGRLKLKRFKDITIFDDTYNSNPLSLRLAIDAISKIKGRKILVMGDMLELGRKEDYLHKEIAKFIKKANISTLISLGERAKITASQVKKKNFCKDVFIARSYQEVKDILRRVIQPEDLILIKGSRKIGMEKIIEDLFY